MRRVRFLVLGSFAFLFSCTADSSLSISPAPDQPLGVGLTARYFVDATQCDDGYLPECDPMSLSALAVRSSGSAVAVGSVDLSDAAFDLTGVALGTSTIDVGGESASASFSLAVDEVADTQVFVPRIRRDSYAYAPARSPAAAFTGATIRIGQESVAPNGDALAGRGSVALSGATDASWADAQDALSTGFATGPLQLTTEHGALALEIVDPAAIASLQLGDTAGTDLHLVVSSQPIELDLFPFTADGRPIVGAGPEPTITVGDPSLLATYGQRADNIRHLTLLAQQAGTTTLELQWGGLRTTFAVTLTPFAP